MEEGSETEKRGWMKTKTALMEEMKRMSTIAAPMVVAIVLQYLLQVIPVVMVGHLGQLSLSSVAIAISITNVSGFSVFSGLAGGLETLCGQAFGAEQYEKFGLYTYTAVISLTMVSAPISVLWIFLDKVLILLGQDPTISLEARKYAIWLIPALFGSAILKPLTRFFQTQSLIFPLLLSSSLVLCFHIVTCWSLVFKLGLGHVGAAIAFSLSTWFNAILLLSFVKYSSACEKTRIPFSKKAFHSIGEFFRFAVPSAAMICLKWWACELLVLLAGLFPNPKLETSVLSICLTISTLHFTIPYGLGAVASTRVSNELGAGNPKAARLAVSAAMVLAVTEALIVSATLFGCRYILGYAYSNDSMVVHYLAVMTPLLCLSVFMDSLQAPLSGVARGSGWQHVGAYVNLGAFYLVGIPIGAVLGFVVHFRAKGLWIGIVSGSIVQSIFLCLITAFTNWKKQAVMARERIFDATSSDENGANHITGASC
ncbi:protein DETOXIFICATION 14-like [Gastrolobium bilobum]|uniref:protein DETOXIFICATION 14-like n=1 Tax=Gastrolobium bilobum TaxID=150636 RepID=UPI002AAF68C1|nr:protein DETOXIFICATION 14-like [Gastrolobium bilobum]